MSDFRQPTSINWNGPGREYGMVNYASDSSVNVVFYTRSVRDEIKSKEERRPIHHDVEYIRMQHPGETSTVIDRPVKEEDRHRFPQKYQQYLHKKTQIPEGTPIDLLFPNNPSVADNLKGFGVYTVEQCSSMSAHAVHNIGMGAQEYQNKAKAFMDSASKGANFHKVQSELEETKRNYKLLERNHLALKKQFDILMDKIDNPHKYTTQMPHVPQYDAQLERLNANHPTQELAEKVKRRRKKVVETPIEEMITESSSAPADNDEQQAY